MFVCAFQQWTAGQLCISVKVFSYRHIMMALSAVNKLYALATRLQNCGCVRVNLFLWNKKLLSWNLTPILSQIVW